MTKNNPAKQFQHVFVLMLVLTSTLFYSHASLADQPKLMFIDLLYLQPGVNEARVEEYFTRITPIVEKHGLKRIGGFKVTKKIMGDIGPNFINLWVVSGPHTFDAIFKDKAYLKNVPFRNSTFDMNKANMFMLSPTFSNVNYTRLN